MRTWATCLSILLLPCLAHAQDTDNDISQLLAACPGGAQWLAGKNAQMRPPATVATPSQSALREELLQMGAEDQRVRAAMPAGTALTPEQTQQWQQVDQHNLQRLRQIIDRQGFPDSSQVGADGAAAAWLLLQHADADPELQSRMLAVLVAREDAAISKEQLALLTDRVLVAQGKPQRYGSQYEGVGAQMKMKPVQAPLAELDQRRAAMGMMPSATYACVLKQM
ncbi:DUF6624 domain-containing protein [Pseudoxanthomonas dokdonensis]|uniref:DUF6624 domain-containing protein n=1 Tax=Pseudoxanthomonas dokdonensis TaxID=344882 RepID=UPI00070E41FD|nr:DUF6624 domain-containing protein [Pseudoxanthomonas dokdonensis]